MKYKWTYNAMGGVSAEVVGVELGRIQKKAGTLTPETVVTAAKATSSPIHPCFEWNDKKAAAAHRLDQARYMLRSIEVVIESPNHSGEMESLQIRAFPHVKDEEGDTVFVTLAQARQTPEYWEQVKAQALAEIKSWQQKYKDIREFEVIFSAIKKIA